MKKNSLFLGVMALIGLFASCSQTETDELAGKTIEKGKQVSVTLTAPDDFIQSGTRAAVPENLKMRYIVEVWDAGADALLQRKESVEGDTDANKFTFDLTTGTYQLLCWADKIDAAATTSSVTIGEVTFNHYTDLFFKTAVADAWTQNGLKCVQFNFPRIDNAYYNNTELDDVFCGKQEVQKTENIIDNLNITLKRPLCKIIFKQKDPTAANTTDICKAIKATSEGEINKYVCLNPYYNVFTQNIVGEGEGSIQVGASPLKISPKISLLPNAATNGELLFCHSFAGLELSNLKHNSDFDVRLEFEKADGAEKELQVLTIPKGTIQVQANRRVILTGNILKPETKGEAANFTLTTDENWSTNGDHTQDLNSSNL